MFRNNGKIIAFVIFFLSGCSNQHEDILNPVEVNYLPCEKEAVQLINPVKSFVRPADNTSNFVALDAGRFVYLCHKHDEWVAVMYPRVGEAIDCNFRSAKQKCSIGWVKNDLMTRSFD